MAVKIPNQNNLNEVIKSMTDTIADIRKTLSANKESREKSNIDINDELKHVKTDMVSVVEFMKSMSENQKYIDVVVNNLITVLGAPGKINKLLASVKVETIDSKNLEAAVVQLRRILNTPKQINDLLDVETPELKGSSVRRALKDILFVCKLPERINKKLAKIDIKSLDTSKLESVKNALNDVFGNGGFIDSIDDAIKRINETKNIGIKKFLAVWVSMCCINSLLIQVVEFGKIANAYANFLRFSIIGASIMCEFVIEFIKILQKIDDIGLVSYLMLPLKIKSVSRLIRRIIGLMENLVILAFYAPWATLFTATTNLVNKTVNNLLVTVELVKSVGIAAIILASMKMGLLKKFIRKVGGLISALFGLTGSTPLMVNAILMTALLNKVLKNLVKVVGTIAEFKIATLIINLLKIKLLNRNIRVIRVLIRRVGDLAETALRYSVVGITGLAAANTIFSLFQNTVALIRATKMGLLFSFRVKKLITGARLIRVLVRTISGLISAKRAAKAAIAVKLVNAIIKSFAHIILNIILLTPLMLMFIVLSPIIIVVFWLFAKVFKIIVRIIAKLVSPKIVIVLMATTALIMMLCVLGIALVALSLIAIIVVKSTLSLLTFFGVLAVVVILLALTGFVMAKATPFLMMALYAIGIVTLTVLAVVLIAAMLWLLTKIELDQDKIKENVKKVMSTVLFIITCLFEDELNDPESKDSVFTRILKVLGGAVAKILMALATCVILIATFVSVACILLIAGMLRLLQNLNLDSQKILSNVDTVFDTVEKILSRFMEDDKDGKKSNRGILLSIVAWIEPSLAKIAEAMMSFAYLFLMFMATLMVLGIASMLRVLQNLDLQPDVILEKVDAVFDTVDSIINRIFGERKDDEHRSNRGILVTIISWVDEGLAKIVEAALSVVYLFLMFVAVTIVLGIASMLRLLQNLDLNTDQIRENVNTVFDTVDLIIGRIFSDRKDDQYPSSRGILTTIISWVDPGLAKIVEAALSVVYLFLMLISISIVLGIAGLLKCIQEIDLDEELILEKINTVFNTVDKLISRVFAPADDNTQAARGIFGSIISFFSPQLAGIIDAIMAIAKLGLIFLAVSIVKGIASSLHEIQEIDIQEQLIMEKVDSIFRICSSIMKQIYEKADTMLPEPENRGIFGSIISFFSPDLADILDALTMIAKLAVVQAAISAVAGVGNALRDIANLDVNLSAAGDKVDKIMGVAENVCERIFSRESKIKFPVPPKERKSVFGALISWAFGGEKSDEERALEAAMKKVEALGVIEAAVGALGNILAAAKNIVDMEVDDLDAATVKVAEVMTMAEKLAETIFGSQVKLKLPEPSKDDIQAALVDLGFDHWWRDARAGEVASAKAQASMKLAMQRVQTLGLIASAIGSIASIIEGVNKIKDYEVPDTSKIGEKVRQVMSTASHVSFIIFEQDGIGQTGGNAAGIKNQIADIKARIDFAKAGADGVGALCQSFTSLMERAKFDESQINATKSKVSSTIKAIAEIIRDVDTINPEAGGKVAHNNCDLIDRISKTVGSFVQVTDKDVKNSKNITENYIKFFKQVDSMDIRKLQHTDWLMRSWASISRDLKGDFEGLAKTINQHIMPMLEKVNETLDKTTKTQQEIIDIMSQPVNINGGGDTTIPPSDIESNPNGTTDLTTPPNQTGRAEGNGAVDKKPDNAANGRNLVPSRAPGIQQSSDIDTKKKYIVQFKVIKEA